MFPRISKLSRGFQSGICPFNNGFKFGRARSALPRKTDPFAYPEGMVAYEEDYIETPEYPEIDEETHQWTDYQRRKRQEILDWHKSIRNRPNPEAKTLEINMPRNYGWRTKMLHEEFFDYDSQEFYKFITQTHVVSNDGLPELYSSPELSEKAKHYAEKIKGRLLDVLKFELHDQTRQFDDNLEESSQTVDFKRSSSIIAQINRVILSELGRDNEHLHNCQVDYEPKIEAFWFIGGQQRTFVELNTRRATIKHLERVKKQHKGRLGSPNHEIKPLHEPVERPVQYKGSPLLQVRCDNPIANFVDHNSELCQRQSNEPKVFPYEMVTYQIFKEYRYASIIPGTWTGDLHNSGHIAFHPRHHLLHETRKGNKYFAEDNENAIQSQAILASFGRLFGQAFYYGFDQFSDLSYPFSGQTVVTDGLNYSFFAYQLNTMKLCQLYLDKHNKQNVCWGTKTMSIFDQQAESINTETLETLLKFYLNPPTPIAAKEPTPYLKASMMEMQDEIEREVIYYNYRDMVSQRWYVEDSMRHRQIPEIYEWERIYKLRHSSRYMEARRRFFEFPHGFPGFNPYLKRYNLLDPRLVHKRLRFLMAEVAAKKEAEQMEAAKRAEREKYERSADDYDT